jgi:hypothetical protein
MSGKIEVGDSDIVRRIGAQKKTSPVSRGFLLVHGVPSRTPTMVCTIGNAGSGDDASQGTAVCEDSVNCAAHEKRSRREARGTRLGHHSENPRCPSIQTRKAALVNLQHGFVWRYASPGNSVGTIGRDSYSLQKMSSLIGGNEKTATSRSTTDPT